MSKSKSESTPTEPTPTPPHLGGHQNRTHVDEGALRYLKEKFGLRSMVDIGCGPGGMRVAASRCGLSWQGVDGDPAVQAKRILAHDFTTGPVPDSTIHSLTSRGWGLAWSVEFLEHVEEQYQDNYMALFEQAQVVLITAAPPGKSGHHHVNCRDQAYWVEVFERHGFRLDEDATREVRAASTMPREFVRQHGLVFVRMAVADATPSGTTTSDEVASGFQGNGTVVHFGFNNESETGLIRRYAESQGCTYWWEGCKNNMHQAATSLKNAAMVVIWNGSQHHTPLAAKLCRKRGIPHCFVEWGLLPQAETFLIDPTGFCSDSILARDLSWINDADMEKLYATRTQLQAQHPLRDEGFVLVPLQIENDSQVLYHSPYRTMRELVAQVEEMYPDRRIIVRPHPKGGTDGKPTHATVSREGTFLEMAARASLVVGITSTTLYEAAILGVPVQVLGDHPLSIQGQDIDRVCAGVLALRVNRTDGDLNSVLHRFGIHPL